MSFTTKDTQVPRWRRGPSKISNPGAIQYGRQLAGSCFYDALLDWKKILNHICGGNSMFSNSPGCKNRNYGCCGDVAVAVIMT